MLTCSLLPAQLKLGRVGKVFTQNEAKTLFGDPVISYDLSVAEINTKLATAKDYVLFTVRYKRAEVTDDLREISTKRPEIRSGKETFFIYSKEVVQEFLNKINSKGLGKTTGVITASITSTGVFTLTAGADVLEMNWTCPPFCF